VSTVHIEEIYSKNFVIISKVLCIRLLSIAQIRILLWTSHFDTITVNFSTSNNNEYEDRIGR